MNLTDARKTKIPGRKKKFVKGRGHASGVGKTCGRGKKGQGARQHETFRPYFEGGQMPVIRRIPKYGFSNNQFRKIFEIVNIGDLNERFNSGDVVDEAALRAKGLVRRECEGVKILGFGPLEKKLTVKAFKFAKNAEEKIKKAGGTAEWLGPRPPEPKPVAPAAPAKAAPKPEAPKAEKKPEKKPEKK